MRYNLDFLEDYCREIGLPARISGRTALGVFLGNGAVLCFQNAEREEDCAAGFPSTPWDFPGDITFAWHFHGDITFADSQGNYVELDILNLLSGIRAGSVVLCERYRDGTLIDRWLAHSEYNDEFRYLDQNEWLVVRRANASGIPESP
jgi:hypothetical protein